MSRRGNCWDNAVAESFFATLKKQTVHGEYFPTHEQATKVIFEYIEAYYNRTRRHSTNGWISPVNFERLYYQSLEGLAVY